MSQQPFNSAALRGAVDLSSLARPGGAGPGGQPGGPGPGPGPEAGPDPDAYVVTGTDQNFTALVNGSVKVPGIVVMWAEQFPGSREYVDVLGRLARSYDGRFQVISVDIEANPGILQAFTPVLQQAFQQIQTLPVVVGLLQGQPVPLFLGVQPEDQTRLMLDKLLEAAVANGVTGRVSGGADEAEGGDGEAGDEGEESLPPLHQEAYDAIERDDLDAAADAYTRAIQENPSDEDAKFGLAQVELMRRTRGLDPQQVRDAAAADPADVQAQLAAADMDVLGGHIEDGFLRLIDLVRVTAGEDRDTVREHLIGLFDVVGAHDERVRKARTSLMSALF